MKGLIHVWMSWFRLARWSLHVEPAGVLASRPRGLCLLKWGTRQRAAFPVFSPVHRTGANCVRFAWQRADGRSESRLHKRKRHTDLFLLSLLKWHFRFWLIWFAGCLNANCTFVWCCVQGPRRDPTNLQLPPPETFGKKWFQHRGELLHLTRLEF